MTIEKPKAEQKLLKVVNKYAGLEAELQLITHPKVFEAVTQLCQMHLERNNYDTNSRDYVSKLAFVFRQEAYMRFGHECLETFALSKILRQAEGRWKAKLPRLDSISWIRAYRNKDARLNADQEEAAENIKRVWAAFGRFMSIASRGLGGGGGSRGRVVQPVDVMDQELWDHHRDVYTLWYNQAKITQVDRRRGSSHISLAAIVFKILIDDLYPEEMDIAYGLVRGSSLKGLKAALSAYWSPEAMAAFGLPPAAPTGPAQAAEPDDSGAAPRQPSPKPLPGG